MTSYGDDKSLYIPIWLQHGVGYSGIRYRYGYVTAYFTHVIQ